MADFLACVQSSPNCDSVVIRASMHKNDGMLAAFKIAGPGRLHAAPQGAYRIFMSYNKCGPIPRSKEATVKILKLPKEKLDLFASVVQQFGELHAPVEQDGKYVFKRLTRWSDARLEYDRTILPPKKYFLPPRETLFRYRPARDSFPTPTGWISASSCSACTPATFTR